MRADELVNYCQLLIGDPEGDYHDREKVLLHVNTALEDISTRSRTLCDWEYIQVQADRGIYGLPDSFLEYKFIGFFYRGELIPLSPGSTQDTAPAIFRENPNIQRVPHTYSHAGNAFVEKYVGTVIAFPGNPDADNSGEVSFFSSVPMPTAKVGDRLINATDNSEGVISELSSGFSQVTFLGLANGEDNQMEIDDIFRVVSQSAHRHAIAISPPPSETDALGAESLYIYMARDHRKFTIDELDNQTDEIELGAEFNSTLRFRVLYYMSMEANGIDDRATIGYDVSYNSDYHSAFLKANSRIKQYLSAWRQGGRRLQPRRTITQSADWSVPNIRIP